MSAPDYTQIPTAVQAVANAEWIKVAAERRGDGEGAVAAEKVVSARRHELNALVLARDIQLRIDKGGLAAADLPGLMTLLASAVTK